MLIERTLRYLGWRGALDEPMRQLLDSCAQEVRTLRPSFAHARFSLSHDPLRLSEAGIVLPSAQLDRSFRMCDACEVVGITLGAEAERLVRYYALIDMARMSVLDAMLSALVELSTFAGSAPNAVFTRRESSAVYALPVREGCTSATRTNL